MTRSTQASFLLSLFSGGKPLKNRKMEVELPPTALWSVAHLPREITGGVQADERGQ